jgi:hypothetical protein
VLASLLAVYSHEGMATLLVVVPMAARYAGGSCGLSRLRPALVPALAGIVAFTTTTLVANRSNYLFSEGHYRIGPHIIGNALDYLVSLYGGRHWKWEYLSTVAALGTALTAGTRLTRFAAAAMIVSLAPFLAFTWANVSRYAYLPSLWCALTLTSGFSDIHQWLSTRAPGRVLDAGGAIVLVAAAVWCVGASRRAVNDEIAWTYAYRSYLESIQPSLEKREGVVQVARPADPRILVSKVPALVRWTLHDPTVTVRIE